MKILIGYDGSEFADAAIDSLQRAGLPQTADALIVSVAEVWLPPSQKEGEIIDFADDPYLAAEIKEQYDKNLKAVEAASAMASRAGERLRLLFPSWKVETESDYGSPAWEILARAGKFEADLIAVGSHGRSALGRLVLGSISQKVLTEADVSVRIGRGKNASDDPSVRVLVGFDGSPGAEAAVDALAARSFKENCEARLIAATDPLVLAPGGFLFQPVPEFLLENEEDERRHVEELAGKAVETLKKAGINASFQFVTGNPKYVLTNEAENWNADAIFVGANAFGSRLERLLLGSVSAAVAARAHCSVEVVRRKKI